MKKTSFPICFTALLAAITARSLLKIQYIDTSTGFYTNDGYLGLAFLLLLALAAAAIAVSVYRKPVLAEGFVRGDLLTGILLFLLGAMVIYGGVEAFLYPVEVQLMGVAVKMFNLVYALYFIGGAAAIGLALMLFGGAGSKDFFVGLLSLFVVIWQAVDMIYRFSSFLTVTTASDQFLETMYMVCSTLFLLNHAGILCGSSFERCGKLTVLFGYLTSLLSLTLGIGQMAGHLILGKLGTGPYDARLGIILLMGIYSAVFAYKTETGAYARR